MSEMRGRPRVARDPTERVPTSIRLRGDLFNQLSEAARQNDWSLGREVEMRLEQSFRDAPLESKLDEILSLMIKPVRRIA